MVKAHAANKNRRRRARGEPAGVAPIDSGARPFWGIAHQIDAARARGDPIWVGQLLSLGLPLDADRDAVAAALPRG